MRAADSAVQQGSQRNIRLVVSDMDGSLLAPGGVLTPRAAQAVARLNSAGIRFAVTSSRPPRGMHMLVEPLALRTPLSGFNGGVITAPELEVLESHTIAPATAASAVAFLRAQGMDAWIFTLDSWFVLNAHAPHVDRESQAVRFAPVVVPEFTEVHFAHAAKIVGVSDDHALVAHAGAEIGSVTGANAAASRSQQYYLDITHPLANKGQVVKALAKRLGFPLSDIATLGDMHNDVLMFRESGFSIAMGNANDEVKQEASVVTDTNDSEGFAKAMEKFILPYATDNR